MKRSILLVLFSLLILTIFINSCTQDINTVNSTISNCAKNLSNCLGSKDNNPVNTTNNTIVNTTINNLANASNTSTVVCPLDVKDCWGAGNVSRMPPTCEFASCAKFGVPPNTCNYTSDCKIVMSYCSCDAVPKTDPRDWINGTYCSKSDCMMNGIVVALPQCINNICVKSFNYNCQDSDGGQDYNTFGTAQLTANSIIVSTVKDTCINKYLLNEAYCENQTVGYINTTNYNCPFGCVNGACTNGTG